MTKHKVTLTSDERESLQVLVSAGKAAARKLAHARILLKADAAPGGPGWAGERSVEAVDVSRATVERVRQRFAAGGLEAAVVRKPQDRPSRARAPGGRGEARLIALAGSEAPGGRAAWALQLLADKVVALRGVEATRDEAVRQALKKTNPSRG